MSPRGSCDAVRFAGAAAPPKPRHGDRAGGAGSRSALGARKLTTVPLQSERIASLFSTMSLRGSAMFDRRIKADGTTPAGGYFCAGAMRPRLQHWGSDRDWFDRTACLEFEFLSGPPRTLILTEISRFSSNSPSTLHP